MPLLKSGAINENGKEGCHYVKRGNDGDKERCQEGYGGTDGNVLRGVADRRRALQGVRYIH